MTSEIPQWYTSSYSENGGACVEVAANLAAAGIVPVRDSKDTSLPGLAASTDAWRVFVGSLKG
ncbi:DUF397 domain-containing protein [Streptomyces sp. NPDC005438]|uniref:DUF397 domain-containing protein n=1 Tax=Streptomyces sp. NPDC005438 TaxID=3156880 RepID=UPI0033B4BCF7